MAYALGFGFASSRRRRSGATVPWTPSSIALEWIDPTQSATVGSSPYRIASPNPILAGFSQARSAKRPAYSSNRLTFDGGDDVLIQAAPATLLSKTTLPDIATSVGGKGPTCTGLAKVSDGWWVGDHGTETPAEPDGNRDAGLIKYSLDFSSVLQRIRLADLGIAQTSVQGVCIDAQDGSLWIACPIASRVYNISTAGALMSTISAATVANANGISYDSINNQLIVMTMDSGAVTWINKSTGASVKTMSVYADYSDMIFFDGSEGSQGMLYVTGGAATPPEHGYVVKYDVATGSPTRSWLLPDTQAIEGMYLESGTAWFCNDEYFHGSSGESNNIARYNFPTTTPAIGTRLILAGVFRSATASGQSKAVVCLGNGLVANRRGIGIYISTTAGTLVLNLNITGTNQSFSFAMGGYGSDLVYYFDINTQAQTVTLYVNGNQVGSAQGITAGAGTVIPAMMTMIGGGLETTAIGRNSPAVVGGALATTTWAERARIEGYLAWQTGNVALLPGGHPYKLVAP